MYSSLDECVEKNVLHIIRDKVSRGYGWSFSTTCIYYLVIVCPLYPSKHFLLDMPMEVPYNSENYA